MKLNSNTTFVRLDPASRLQKDVMEAFKYPTQKHKNLQAPHAELMQPPGRSAAHSYTSLTGEIISVDSLDWLEDGWYWLEDDYCWESDEDDDGFFTGDKYPCSRYSIGVDENGDGLSVWLNDDMQEVEV